MLQVGIPSVVGAFLFVSLLIVLCVLFAKQRHAGKKGGQEGTSGERYSASPVVRDGSSAGRGVPVIFADEIDECSLSLARPFVTPTDKLCADGSGSSGHQDIGDKSSMSVGGGTVMIAQAGRSVKNGYGERVGVSSVSGKRVQKIHHPPPPLQTISRKPPPYALTKGN